MVVGIISVMVDGKGTMAQTMELQAEGMAGWLSCLSLAGSSLVGKVRQGEGGRDVYRIASAGEVCLTNKVPKMPDEGGFLAAFPTLHIY